MKETELNWSVQWNEEWNQPPLCRIQDLGSSSSTYPPTTPYYTCLSDRDSSNHLPISWTPSIRTSFRHSLSPFIPLFVRSFHPIGNLPTIHRLFLGECWSGPGTEETYYARGRTSKCVNHCFETCKPFNKYCSGRHFANTVYRLAGSSCCVFSNVETIPDWKCCTVLQ